MKIASITPIYNCENFLRPFFKQLSVFDENIVLLGNEPFADHVAAGFVSKERDNSEIILRTEFPRVKIYNHDFKYYDGGLFNFAIDKAKELNCDVIIKLDPDMFFEKKSLDILLDKVKTTSYSTLLLDMRYKTMVYEEDLDHGVPQSLWNVGNEPFIVKTNEKFIVDGTNIKTTGDQSLIDWDGFVIHHLSGFKRHDVSKIEKMSEFPGWKSAPLEIKQLFI